MAIERLKRGRTPAYNSVDREVLANDNERRIVKNELHGDPSGKKIEKLDLYTLMSSDENLIKPYWGVILKCVEWIYSEASSRNISDDLATGTSADRSTIRGRQAYDQAASKIRTMATEFFTRTGASLFVKGRELNADIAFQLIVNEILGLGIIEPIWNNDDPRFRVEEVWIDGPDRVRISVNGKKRIVRAAKFKDADHVMAFCDSILQQAHRDDLHVDVKNPYVDARLRDLSRVAIASTTICPGGPLVSIRRHPSEYFTITQLDKWGTCNQEIWCDLAKWMSAGLSMLVIGETGSGKTSFLDALSGLFPQDDRIMTIEDVLELELNPNKQFKVPGCEKREPNKEGLGGFSIRDHVKMSLRMAPDIVVIGEVRDASAYDLVDAANTGHQVFSTIHANGPDDAIVRLTNLISMGGEISGPNALPMIASAFDLIVYLARLSDGSRKLMSISEVDSRAKIDELTREPVVDTKPIWEFKQTGVGTNGKIIGEYTKKDENGNIRDLSPMTQARHRIKFLPDFTWEDCVRLEGFPDGIATKIPSKI
jgi:pilus assembly protein CpaF